MPSTPLCADRAAAPAPTPTRPFARLLPWLLLAAGALGFASAFALTVEKFTLAANPSYVPTCSINPVLNCGSVMSTEQASVFGFPNSLIGVGGFAALATVGTALLAGAVLSWWFWAVVQVAMTAAVVFVHWLIGQSLYEIGALCPYCMVVWAVTVPAFWYVTLANLDRLTTARGGPGWARAIVRTHSVPLTLWFLTLAGLIAVQFWSYWSTLA
ncbi:unannotated protein [freshwater metagenome]|uniref:Unannotated protein n=1 Tax=freshwater metagenome TaxID=449393 RepID=A0A6J7HRC2_9ZZZZ|nr:Vitamin K epoxide reductase [Actinomycetota bacterium]